MYPYQNFIPNNYQDRMYQNSYLIQQSQMQQQPEYLQGTIVDSLDVVRSRNCNLDGSPTYYPKSDKTEIYCKQLNPQTGAGTILTYKLQSDESLGDSSVDFTTLLSGLKQDISELKDLVMENITNPQSGGGK